MSAITDWIRPWYPGEISTRDGAYVGHLDPACEELLRVRTDVIEGTGWLDPRRGQVCPPCLLAHDPKLHDDVFGGAR